MKVEVDWCNIHDYFDLSKKIESEMAMSSLEQHSEPDLTIAIPTFHREDTLTRALESALKQNAIAKIEIIIVDNEPDEKLSAEGILRPYVLKYPNIKYYRNRENVGMAGNWNKCLLLAKGKWLLMLHDDDFLSQDYLNCVYPWLDRSGCTVCGVFHSNHYDEDIVGVNNNYNSRLANKQNMLGLLRGWKPFIVKEKDLFANVFPSPVCSIVDRKKAIEFGGYDERRDEAIDEKFFARQVFNGKVIILPKVLSYRGVRSNDSLNVDRQFFMLETKYSFWKYLLSTRKYTFKKLQKIRADISVRYMVQSIKGHFGSDINADEFLLESGVSPTVLKLSNKMIAILKYIPLLKLIIRKAY